MPIACDQRKIQTSTTKPKKESRQSGFSPRLYFDVEHMMGKLKVFVILCRCYQNRCKRLSLRFNSITTFYNLELNLKSWLCKRSTLTLLCCKGTSLRHRQLDKPGLWTWESWFDDAKREQTAGHSKIRFNRAYLCGVVMCHDALQQRLFTACPDRRES